MIVALRVVGGLLPQYRDVVVRTESGHTVAELCKALSDHLHVPVPGLTSQRTGRVLSAPRSIDGCGLISGDVVMIGVDCHVVLDVVSGAGVGGSHPIGSGRCVIGRGSAADLSLADMTVSRRHAELDVTAAGVALTPVGPVRVNGLLLDSTLTIEPGDVISIGRSELLLRPPPTSGADSGRIRSGFVEFRRTPYRQPVVRDRGTVTIGPIPERHDPRRTQLLSIAGPLLAGLVLFAFVHRVEFLALTLLSPVLLIATALDDRRAGRRGHRGRVAAFRSMLADRQRVLAGFRAAECAERITAAPDLVDLMRRADQAAIDLWARGQGSEDFLRLRLGRGSVAGCFDAVLAAGGEQALRAEAAAALQGATTVHGVPITVDLAGRVLAIQGDRAVVGAVVTSLATQAACLHAPDSLSVVAAIGRDHEQFDWIKWLPHARVANVARSRVEAESLVCALLEDARRRAAGAETGAHVLAIIDAELASGVSAIGELLELAPAAGIGVVWMAACAADVPHQASSVLEVGSLCRLTPTAPGSEAIALDLETATRAIADRVARALAAVREVGGDENSGIAREVALLDVVGRGAAAKSTVTRWWQHTDGLELRVPIGIGVAGPVVIDLVEDGPHMLIAGTTGSGKSELLQSVVTAIAVRYSPQRVNFLFVDYKGGASTKGFEHLPHTVGYVTNLDAALARRAIVSLRAELERRMKLLEGRAKDLRELFALAADEAPAALVIVIDEFATLAKQLPEFVAGVIDVAQRGRSLGIHLMLSTQRLAGAVDENIVANTNVRIALRLLERADSTDMVGTAVAAEIPVAMRGRGVCRVGSYRAVSFQSAYGGCFLGAAPTSNRIVIDDFADSRQVFQSRPLADAVDGPTQQQAVLDAVAAAADGSASAPPHRPWREPLPDVVTLDDLAAIGAVRTPAIGLFDAPEMQQQGPLAVDLERGGGCLVFGSGGAGKTTALRSLALALTRAAGDGEDVAIVVLDGPTRGLAMLRSMPTVVEVAAADDPEAITRHIDALDRELGRRRQLLADAAAENLSAYNATHPSLPRIVVLIDDISSLLDGLGGHRLPTGGELWSDRLVRVLVEGRQAGIHGVVAADRRNAVPSRLLSSVSNRIVLGFADRASYADHGIASDAPVLHEMTPGRGWWNGRTVIQVAVAARDHSASGQRHVIERTAEACRVGPPRVLKSSRLPAWVSLRPDSRPAPSWTVTIGVEDLTGADLTLDLSASPIAVVGPPRSGRSTALRTIAAAFAGRHELYALGAATSGLVSARTERSAFGTSAAVAPLLERLGSHALGRDGEPRLLLVDDLDLLDDIGLAHLWDRVAAAPHLRIVAAVDLTSMSGFTSNPLATALKRSRQMLVLQPDEPGQFLQLTGVRLERRPGLEWVPGRGVLLAGRATRILQVAVPDDARRRTRVRSSDMVSGVTVMTSQSLRTAAVATPVPR